MILDDAVFLGISIPFLSLLEGDWETMAMFSQIYSSLVKPTS